MCTARQEAPRDWGNRRRKSSVTDAGFPVGSFSFAVALALRGKRRTEQSGVLWMIADVHVSPKPAACVCRCVCHYRNRDLSIWFVFIPHDASPRVATRQKVPPAHRSATLLDKRRRKKHKQDYTHTHIRTCPAALAADLWTLKQHQDLFASSSSIAE